MTVGGMGFIPECLLMMMMIIIIITFTGYIKNRGVFGKCRCGGEYGYVSAQQTRTRLINIVRGFPPGPDTSEAGRPHLRQNLILLVNIAAELSK